MSYTRNANTADFAQPTALHDTKYGDGNGDGNGYGNGTSTVNHNKRRRRP